MSPSPTPCAACHVNNNYTLTSADCMTCHTPDWNKTQTIGGNVPNHVTAGFPIDSIGLLYLPHHHNLGERRI